MEKNKDFELIVHEGKRPLWQTIIASLIFTIMFYQIYEMGKLFYYLGFSQITLDASSSFVYGIVYCLFLGISFSISKSVLIDVDADKLVSRFTLGPFSYDKISAVPELNYVSVFKKGKYDYQVNLWYKGNKHFIMCDFNTIEPAFEFAHYVANKLKMDLLDATVKGCSEWISVKPIEEINLNLSTPFQN